MNNFVIFGASGNLASTKILPALWEIYEKDYKYKYIGYGRKEFSDEEFQKYIEEVVPNSTIQFRKQASYITGEYNLKNLLQLKRSLNNKRTIYYLALPSRFEIIKSVILESKKAGLFDRDFLLVIEKPFGEDYKSAKEMITFLEENVGKNNLFLIDHYLAKDSIRNLISLRFANPVFENLWSNEFIKHIEIKALEDIDIRGRAEYYDKSGAIKDMIQSHILQILSLVTMDRPSSHKSEYIHKQKSDVLQYLQMYQDSFKNNIDIGQYKDYQLEDGISENSLTETYVQLKLEINNDRWKGVPITLKTGKKLKERKTQIVVYFKGFTDCIWKKDCDLITANKLEINIYPENDIQLFINSNIDNSISVQTPLRFSFSEKYKSLQPYAKVLIDIYNDEKAYTPSIDEILTSWEFIDKIEDYLEDKRSEILRTY